MTIDDVIATFGSVEKARECLSSPLGVHERYSAKAAELICNLALLGLDSLAADPEREAKASDRVTELRGILLDLAVGDDYRAYLDELCRMADRPAPPSPSVVAEKIVRDVAELPDRDSPEDWPEAMLVTSDELRAIVLAALAASNANARGGQ